MPALSTWSGNSAGPHWKSVLLAVWHGSLLAHTASHILSPEVALSTTSYFLIRHTGFLFFFSLTQHLLKATFLLLCSFLSSSIGTPQYSIIISALWASLIQVIPTAIMIYVTLPVASWMECLTLILQNHHTISGTVWSPASRCNNKSVIADLVAAADQITWYNLQLSSS